MVCFSPDGNILSLLVQRKYAKKARPDEAYLLRSGIIVRAALTEHPVPNRQLDSPCHRPCGPDRTITPVLAGFRRGKGAALMFRW
jgi:hypothetical protein